MDGQVKLGGIKNDNGKPKISLVARSTITAIAAIMGLGIDKYGRDNWRAGLAWSRPYDALQRHLLSWWEGESVDPESRRSHLHHALCELMFLVEYEEKSLGHDDRYKEPKDPLTF